VCVRRARDRWGGAGATLASTPPRGRAGTSGRRPRRGAHEARDRSRRGQRSPGRARDVLAPRGPVLPPKRLRDYRGYRRAAERSPLLGTSPRTDAAGVLAGRDIHAVSTLRFIRVTFPNTG